jgi:hypothetical protein
MTQAGNLLRAAKAKISDPKDWTQEGVYVTADGCLCAQGALNRAFIPSGYSVAIHDRACILISRAVRKLQPYYMVTKYNDDPTTTHADIMNLFDDAAEMADAPTTGE